MSEYIVQVLGVPMDEAESIFTIECSECGPMVTALRDDVHSECMVHMRSHGIDTSPWEAE